MRDLVGQSAETVQSKKAALAGAIEVLSSIAQEQRAEDVHHVLEKLSAKLTASRFNLAVLGQMKRGKSSFINALLGAEVLPTGILPLTSVITRIRYGARPLATIHYQTGQADEIPCNRLHEFITETENPGNRKRVATADVIWPSSLLGMGLDLIDTPGIGSTHDHNTSTTEEYLCEVDAGVMVLSVDPPITAVEAEFLHRLRHDIPRLLFVVNKTDLASDRETEAVMGFLGGELRNRIGIADPELFPVSARRAFDGIGSQSTSSASSGIEPVIQRLRYFASEEKEQVLTESVAMDVLGLAIILRFAASIGMRAHSMSGEELSAKKRELSRVLSRADQELRDLRHLLRGDTGVMIARIENDLREHIQLATPTVRAHLTTLRQEHPKETRESLGKLLDHFLRSEVERIYEDWRTQEDERVRHEMAVLQERFVERTNQILDGVQRAAGGLFNVSTTRISFQSSLTVESHLYYHTEPVFKFLLDKLIFVLPRGLLRRVVFHRMLRYIDVELGRNSGRIRYDYLERVEKSVAAFEQKLSAAVAMVTDNLRIVLEPQGESTISPAAIIHKLDHIMTTCSVIAGEATRSEVVPLSPRSSRSALHEGCRASGT